MINKLTIPDIIAGAKEILADEGNIFIKINNGFT